MLSKIVVALSTIVLAKLIKSSSSSSVGREQKFVMNQVPDHQARADDFIMTEMNYSQVH